MSPIHATLQILTDFHGGIKQKNKKIRTGGLKIHQFSIFEHFFRRFEKNDAKGMNVTQPIWLPGCPEKGHFSDKNAFISVVCIIFSISQRKLKKGLSHTNPY